MKTTTDYSQKANWCKFPQITKDVDTFYIFATEYIMGSFEEGAPDYGTLDNQEMIEGMNVEYLQHATTYADSTNVFAPYYRQTGLRFAGDIYKRDGNFEAALIGTPIDDIMAALDYYFEHYNEGRPFIIAGHSQGSALVKVVLMKYFKEHPDYYRRMVAAYVIGYSVTKEDLENYPYLKFATGESDAGVIVSWNTEGPKNVEENAKTVVLLPNAISINPLNWKRDETYAPASENLGSLVVNEETAEPEIGDLGADAQVNLARGTIVTHAKVVPMPEDAAKVAAEFFGPDGRHGEDYTYFYNNIKDNVAKRIATFKTNMRQNIVGTGADLVVYGKIFTSDSDKVVEAFAVKDGKYVYVGAKAGAEAFIEAGKTEVVDYSGKGLVMPSCGNGHAHYSIGVALPIVGTVAIGLTLDQFMAEAVPAAVKKARETGATSIFGFGWNYITFMENMPTRQQLDAICSDIPIYFADDEGHKGLANTLMLVKAGIMKADGTVLKKDKDIRGGEIVMGADGTPTGFLKEQAGTYTRSFLDTEKLYPVDIAKIVVSKVQEQLLSEGYTMYIDGWGNYFFNHNYFKAAQQMDQTGKMNFVLGLTYEIESWMNVDEELKNAADVQKYATTHVKTNWLKLFMDGTVEGGTGFVDPLYPDGHQGLANWTEEELTDITRKTNANGITMHIHTMGNKAVNTVVSAYVNGGKDEMRNTLVHVRNVNASDFKRMADHNMYIVSGMLWHHCPSWAADYIREHGLAPAGQEDKSYPMKSYFDNGITMTSHSDYPATSGSPDDPFGIMEIAVTGVLAGENGTPWWSEELITREQAIASLTINVAKQMLIENERGSISTGKYADFLLVNKDVLSCPANEIHEAKPTATYFEGKKVFSTSADPKDAGAPDYSKESCWYKIPAITKDFDTFYIYSTIYFGANEGDPDYATLDNREMLDGIKVEHAIKSSVFEESTNLFIPLYRQSGMKLAGDTWKKTGSIEEAIKNIPYGDITAALDYYFENYNEGRPFVIAGHSQGSAILRHVLKHYFKEHPDYYKRMVAAYAIGYSITKEDLEANPHMKFATGETDTGVIISWHAEGPKSVGSKFLSAAMLPNGISINPLNWSRDETYAPASMNLGSIVLDENTGATEIRDIEGDAQVDLARGTVITNAKAIPNEMVEFAGPQSYHQDDYSIFYNNVKDNVAKRIAAYKTNR